MSTPIALYFSYLLRLWLAGDGDQPQWRASLDEPVTGERVGFSNVEEMFAYLKKKMQSEWLETKPSEESRIP